MSLWSRWQVKKSSTPISESDSVPEFEFKLHPLAEDELAATSTSASTIALSQGPASKGFLTLPVELLAHIVSYLTEIRDEHLSMSTHYIGSGSNPEDLLVRFNTLRALSQLSPLSRSIFLPLLWERFQVCLTPKPGWQWRSYIGYALQRKSQGLMESKHLWPYVKVVTVAISQFQSSQVMPSFVQLLGVLPNVHTLEVLYVTIDVPSPESFETYFRGYTFPSIHKVVLSAYAREILRCCPNVKEVTCNRDLGEYGQLADSLINIGCSELEVIQGFTIGLAPLKRLSKTSPSLRSIRIDGRIFTQRNPTKYILQLSAYSVFHSLRVIEIECFEHNNLEQEIKLASDILRDCAENKPVTKKQNLRGKMNGDNVGLANLKATSPEPRLVRVLRYAYSNMYGRTHLDFVPVRIEEFPVKIQ